MMPGTARLTSSTNTDKRFETHGVRATRPVVWSL